MSESTRTLPLVFEAPKGRGKPPRHLADIDPENRRVVAEEFGIPGYRIDQVGNHYFSRHTRDASTMTDLPADTRGELVGRQGDDQENPVAPFRWVSR